MNRFDERYNFRLAKKNDVDRIMKFIHDEWNENHILAHNRELFEWQYGRTEYGDQDNINFVLMEEKTGELVGVVGFIQYSNDISRLHISQAMTMVKPIGMLPMSGLELMKRQMLLVGEKLTFSYGTNPTTIKPLWERCFKNEVGVMQQYYMLNPLVSAYKIADIKSKKIIIPYKSYYKLEETMSLDDTDFDFLKDYERLPYKSREYLDKRYFKHPIYKYKKWFVINEEIKKVAILFGREINIDDIRILRLVDFRGELNVLYELGSVINRMMIDNQYEYIEVMASGLSEEKMEKCGFVLLDPNGENIIPNYFEPFERKNITVHFQKSADVVIFKADGDQDRPNK